MQGIKNYVDNVSAKFEVVPTGYDDTKWNKLEGVEKQKMVMTVGGSPDERTFKRKGLDFLLKVAKEMPDTKFIIVGKSFLERVCEIVLRTISNSPC